MGKVLRAPKGTTRQQRKRMGELGDKVDLATQADAKFFQRFQHRSHRLRTMSLAEREQLEIVAGTISTPPDGERWVVLVRQIVPGARLRRFFTVMEGSDLDQSEEACRSLYEHLTAPSGVSAGIERKLREALARKGGVA